MKILVTGGTGLIGAPVVAELLRGGHQVRLLARRASTDRDEFPDGVEAVDADLGEPESLAGATTGCETVIHIAGIAAENPPAQTYEKINVRGTENLLHSAAETGAPYFIFLSSLGADGGTTEYHASKRRAERAVQRYPGPWLILRPGNVYGPGDETVSTLLKMVRVLPAVPLAGRGDQRFQPLWVDDLALALALAVERRGLAGQIHALVGPETVTTEQLLDQMEVITGRAPLRIPVPVSLANAGTHLIEKLGGAEAMQAVGLTTPIDRTKLQLLEEETLVDETANALVHVFGIEPTPVADGLAMLADSIPEQTLAEGVGALTKSLYWADIIGGAHTAESLLETFRDHIAEVMPIEFAAEPGAPRQAEAGATMTGALPGRGHFQVRVEAESPRHLTLMTLEGHPLAGVLTFATEPTAEGVRFSVSVISRPATAVDWLAMKTVGRIAQGWNWRNVVRQVIALSGGGAPAGVQRTSAKLSAAESEQLAAWSCELVHDRKREERTTELRSLHP